MMSVKLKRLTALLLSACLAAGNITTAFGAPVQQDPEPGARVRTSRLISTEETVWRYLDDNTDPAAADDTKEETPGSPSNASPSDASPSNASAKYGFYRFAAGKNKASSKTGRLVWTSADYDDSGWKEARGSFGAKKGEIADLGDGLIPYTLLAQYIEGPDVAEDTDIPAYFFRTTIELEDIDSISALNGEIFYDDAAIIYINGEEVHRAGVPEGGYTQNLEYGGTNAGTPINNKFQITDLSMLKEGSNTVSVELHQGRANSSDIYFDFCSLEIGTPASESDEFITTEGTVWNYLENNTDPAEGSEDRTVWTYPEFADEQWKSGKGSFGAKKGAIADLGGGYIPDTLLKHYIDDTKTAVPAYFFRTDIYLNDVSDLEALEAEIAYDDAVIVYINGKNVYEGQVPEGGYDKNLAYGSANGLSAPSHDTITINDVSMLRDGVNTIAVELHQDRAGSSDIYFDFISLKAAQPKPFKAISLGVWNDETQTAVTWYSSIGEDGKVRIAEKADMDGDSFPEQAFQFAAERAEANDAGFYSFQAVMTGLEPDTDYVYQVGAGETWSDIYEFTTRDYENGFNFLLAGDPQIGAGSTDTDIKGWQNTMETAMKAFPETSFLISAGDQVNTASNEAQYAGYLSPKELLSLPTAVNVGNHDAGSSAYSQHFQVPNVSSMGMTEKTGKFGGDYWYTYNNVLFMSLNSNNMSTAEHREFMKAVLDENGADSDWTVVTFHHSIYSTASHESDNDIIQRRAELSPVFTELGIDVVLMGHDHVYTRSYMMNGNDPVVPADGTVPESVTDPAEGEVLYVTANSASGSKYYSIHNKDFPYAAVMNQESTPNITNVEVTDNSFAITTYRTTDMSEVDHFTIYRTEAPKPQPDVTGDTVAEILESLDQALEQAETEGERQEILKKAAEAAEALSYDPNTMDESEMDEIKKLEDMVLAGYSELAAETDVQSKKVTGVTVEGAVLSVPLKAGVKAVSVLKVSDMELPEALGFETEDVIALDIRLDIISDDPEVSGGNIQPKVPVRITIDAPEDIDLNRLVLMHYTNGAYEDVKFTVKDGAISFVVNALSPFVLAEKAEADKPDDGGDGSDDGSSDNGPSDNGPSDSGSSDNGSSDNGSSGNGSSSSVQGSWIKDQTGWWYQYQNKTYPVNTWVSIQGIWYHFDQAGYMQTGWIQVNGVWYYLQPSGAMVASDWVLYQDKWYYFNQDGAMATAPVHYKGTEYRFDESGACINP